MPGVAGARARADAAALDASLRDAKVVRRGEYDYLIHPLLDGVPRCPPGLLRAWVAWAREQDCARGATLLLAPEAMGLPLVAALALDLGVPYVLARKRAYGLGGERSVPSRTGYGASTLHLNDVRPGDRVLVVDDVLSTGGTLDALLGALRAAGCGVTGALVAVDKGSARPRLEKAHGVPVLAMRTVRVSGGRAHLD